MRCKSLNEPATKKGKLNYLVIFAKYWQGVKQQVLTMATFGEFLRTERNKKWLNQSDFGQSLGIIMTEISKIENGHKKFPFNKLEALAKFLERDYLELKNLYVADKLVDAAHKYECSDAVFSVAENQSKYLRSKNVKQGKMQF